MILGQYWRQEHGTVWRGPTSLPPGMGCSQDGPSTLAPVARSQDGGGWVMEDRWAVRVSLRQALIVSSIFIFISFIYSLCSFGGVSF